MCIIFGDEKKIEFFGIPQVLYGDFSVFGVEDHCKEATEFTLKTLNKNERVEILVLLGLELNVETQNILRSLQGIQSFGVRIYLFLKIPKKNPKLEIYKGIAERGMVLLSKN